MKCRKCGFKSQISFFQCPLCGAFPRLKKSYVVVPFKNLFSWVRDRRICLISKRQNIDNRLYKHHLLPSTYRGMYRIWWVYRLLDVIPIWIVQDPNSIFIFDPMPEQKPPVQNDTNNTGMN